MSFYNQWGTPLPPPIRRTVFISFAQSNRAEVDAFVTRWTQQEKVFIPKSVGVAFGDDLINSDNSDYVIARIRRDHLADSTITLLLLGGCTHSRRFIRLATQSIASAGPELPTQRSAWGSASIGQRVWSRSPPAF
jgi:hypothetical protein